jgi:hypothetical protein
MPIYALQKSDGVWIVFELEKRRVLFEAQFVEAWAYANELAARTAPASVVALNDEGNVVAQAILVGAHAPKGVEPGGPDIAAD